MAFLQHFCDGCNEPEVGNKLSLCRDCGIVEYCSKTCQRRHWKTHKPDHIKAVAETKEKKRIAALEALDFPKESFIQHANASWDDSPEVRPVLIDILKAYTEKKCEGLMIYTKDDVPGQRYGNYYPLRFIGNGDRTHSEAHYTTGEVPAIEVEHCMGCKSEKTANMFLFGFEYESIELDKDLFRKFRFEVMNRGFWFRIDGEKQYDFRGRDYLSRGHIAPVQWDGSLEIRNSDGDLAGLGGNVFDKSKIEARYLQEAVDGLRFSQEVIDNVNASMAQMDSELLQGINSARVTPQRPESP